MSEEMVTVPVAKIYALKECIDASRLKLIEVQRAADDAEMRVAANLAALRAQRDALLAAMRKIAALEYWSAATNCCATEAVGIARSAIAACEGGE